jgi:Putative MetA-pathway of phenol degradation
MTPRNTSLCMVVALLTFLPVMSKAQSAGPRDFLNTPVYSALFFLDLIDTQADTANAADETGLALPNNEGIVRTGVASLLYSFPIGTQYGGVQLSGGRGSVDIRGPYGRVYASGFTDPSVTFHVNFFGAPALRMNEFPSAVPETFLSFHLTVNAPLGSYDSNSAANIGGNRWMFTPIVNLDITRDEGVSWLDLYAGVRFFGDNNAYLGTNQLSQHPLSILTAHYSHNIGSPKTWFSIGVFYDHGGETFINDVPQNNAASGFRPSVNISRAFGKIRITLRLDDAASKPADVSANRSLFLKISGPLSFK